MESSSLDRFVPKPIVGHTYQLAIYKLLTGCYCEHVQTNSLLASWGPLCCSTPHRGEGRPLCSSVGLRLNGGKSLLFVPQGLRCVSLPTATWGPCHLWGVLSPWLHYWHSLLLWRGAPRQGFQAQGVFGVVARDGRLSSGGYPPSPMSFSIPRQPNLLECWLYHQRGFGVHPGGASDWLGLPPQQSRWFSTCGVPRSMPLPLSWHLPPSPRR